MSTIELQEQPATEPAHVHAWIALVPAPAGNDPEAFAAWQARWGRYYGCTCCAAVALVRRNGLVELSHRHAERKRRQAEESGFCKEES